MTLNRRFQIRRPRQVPVIAHFMATAAAPVGLNQPHPWPAAPTAPVGPTAPLTSQCPGVAAFALAAAGKLIPDQHQVVVQHVGQCATCKKSLNHLAEQFATWSGRVLYKGHLIWPNDWTWLALYEKYLYPDAAGGQSKTRVIDRRFTLIQLAKAVRHLSGSTAECGVLGGVGSAMICKTLEGTYQPNQRHWGFDSFEGLPEPDKIDISKQSWQKKGSLAISPQVALNNLADFEYCTLVKGWIPQLLPACRGPHIPFVAYRSRSISTHAR